MYTIRVDAPRKLLFVELSGRLTTDEGLRAISQATALMEASDLVGVHCDTSELMRGPGGLLLVAAAVAAAHRPGMFIAFVGRPRHLRTIERLLRFSGLTEGVDTFEVAADAQRWLELAIRPARKLSRTELLHAEALGLVAPKRPAAARSSRFPAA